jgi:predicted transcriptional regulator of viral defense system
MREETRPRRGGLAELAAAQHGVVSGRQLGELGYTTSAIDRWLAKGHLHRLHRGTYAVGHVAISRRGACLAAVLACGKGAVLSHLSAAWLWGLTKSLSPVMHVTVAASRADRERIVVHSSARLGEEDRTVVESVPTTSIPRTLLDSAAIQPRSLPRILQRAERLGLMDLIAIDDLLRHSRGARGAARLRASLVDHRDPAFTRSGLERRFLRLVAEAGLPRPSTNLFVAGHELDAYWADRRFAVELDTYDYHGDRRSFEADRVRQEELKLAGIEMVRITGARLDREPAEVMRRLRTLLQMHGRV